MYAIVIDAPDYHGDSSTVHRIVHAEQVVRYNPRQVAHYVPGSPTDGFAWALGRYDMVIPCG